MTQSDRFLFDRVAHGCVVSQMQAVSQQRLLQISRGFRTPRRSSIYGMFDLLLLLSEGRLLYYGPAADAVRSLRVCARLCLLLHVNSSQQDCLSNNASDGYTHFNT